MNGESSVEREHQIGSQPLRLHPPYLAAAMQRGEAHLYFVYEALRSLARHPSVGKPTDGVFAKAMVLATIRSILGLSQESSRAYTYLTAGDGAYWRVEQPGTRRRRVGSRYKNAEPNESKKADKRRVGLFSHARIDQRLEPTMAATFPVEIPIGEVIHHSEISRRSFLVALSVGVIAARGSGSMSCESLCEITGLSRSTVKRALKQCPGLITKKAYEILHEDRSKYEVYRRRSWVVQSEGRSYGARLRVRERDGAFILVAQRSNVYSLPLVARVAMKRRPDALKARDAANRVGVCRRVIDPNARKARTKAPLVSHHLAAVTPLLEDSKFEMYWKQRNPVPLKEQYARPTWAEGPLKRWNWDKQHLLCHGSEGGDTN